MNDLLVRPVGYYSQQRLIELKDQLPASAEEARVVNCPFYYNRKPCKHKHLGIRNTKNGTCIECTKASMKKHVEQSHVIKKYDLLREEYDALLQAQGNQCAICLHPFTKTPHVDHSHHTGEIRGLLCRSCNVGIGFFNDNIELLQRAITYLAKGTA